MNSLVGKGEGHSSPSPLSQGGQFPLFTGEPLSGTGRSHRSVPQARRHVGSTAGETYASDKKTTPSRPKCFRQSRQLSEARLRLNFMQRIRIRSHLSKSQNRARQWENVVA